MKESAATIKLQRSWNGACIPATKASFLSTPHSVYMAGMTGTVCSSSAYQGVDAEVRWTIVTQHALSSTVVTLNFSA